MIVGIWSIVWSSICTDHAATLLCLVNDTGEAGTHAEPQRCYLSIRNSICLQMAHLDGKLVLPVFVCATTRLCKEQLHTVSAAVCTLHASRYLRFMNETAPMPSASQLTPIQHLLSI